MNNQTQNNQTINRPLAGDSLLPLSRDFLAITRERRLNASQAPLKAYAISHNLGYSSLFRGIPPKDTPFCNPISYNISFSAYLVWFFSLLTFQFNASSNPKKVETAPKSHKTPLNFNFALFLALLFCLFSTLALASTFEIPNEKIADAIYLAEGGRQTRFPFGIKSVTCEGYSACRAVCINTVRNNKKRFLKQSKYKDFLQFLGSRYCPPSAHSLNKNWVRNVKHFLNRAGSK